MSTHFRTKYIPLPIRAGRGATVRTVEFPSRVKRAAVVLNGFRLSYYSKDRNINTVEADTDIISIDNKKVTFRVEYNLGDKNFDDPYGGYVTATIIADL